MFFNDSASPDETEEKATNAHIGDFVGQTLVVYFCGVYSDDVVTRKSVTVEGGDVFYGCAAGN